MFMNKKKKTEEAKWDLYMAQLCLAVAEVDRDRSAELAYDAMCLREDAIQKLGFGSAYKMANTLN